MRSRLLTSTVLALTLLSGCTTYVQVSSDPEGAMISSAEGSTTYGRAPISIPFDKDALEASGGRIPGFIATWPSGARPGGRGGKRPHASLHGQQLVLGSALRTRVLLLAVASAQRLGMMVI